MVVLDQALNDRNDGLNCLPAMTGDNPLAPFPLYESKAQLAGAALNFLVSSRPEGVSRPGTAARTVETDISAAACAAVVAFVGDYAEKKIR